MRNLQKLSEATQRLPEPLKVPCAHIPLGARSAAFAKFWYITYLGDIDLLPIAGVVDQHLDIAVADMLRCA